MLLGSSFALSCEIGFVCLFIFAAMAKGASLPCASPLRLKWFSHPFPGPQCPSMTTIWSAARRIWLPAVTQLGPGHRPRLRSCHGCCLYVPPCRFTAPGTWFRHAQVWANHRFVECFNWVSEPVFDPGDHTCLWVLVCGDLDRVVFWREALVFSTPVATLLEGSNSNRYWSQ